MELDGWIDKEKKSNGEMKRRVGLDKTKKREGGKS